MGPERKKVKMNTIDDVKNETKIVFFRILFDFSLSLRKKRENTGVDINPVITIIEEMIENATP